MPFCILSVFLNNERIHQNTLGIHAKYVFLKVIENAYRERIREEYIQNTQRILVSSSACVEY